MPDPCRPPPTVAPAAGASLKSPVPAPSAVPLVRWLKDLGRSAADTTGGKGANLGEMMRSQLSEFSKRNAGRGSLGAMLLALL